MCTVMHDSRCINCGDPETESHKLLLRNNSHDEVPLCDGCHEAIQQELDVSN